MINLTGQLEVDVKEASIPSTRRKIERGLSDIEIGGSGISGQLSQDVNGATGESGVGATSIQAEQLSVLEDINDNIEKMAVSGGGGGGGESASDTVLDLALAKRVASGGATGGILSKLSGLGATTIGGLSFIGGTAATALGSVASFGRGFSQSPFQGVSQMGSNLGEGLLGLPEESDGPIPNFGIFRFAEEVGRATQTSVTGLDQMRRGEFDREQFLTENAPGWLRELKGWKQRDPAWIQNLSLQTPSWLNGPIGIDAPEFLRDPPNVGFDIPPGLRELLGLGSGGSAGNQGIPPASAYVNDDGNEQFRPSNQRFNIDLRIEHRLRNATQEFERAIEDAVSSSSALERVVQREMRKEFDRVR